MLESRNEWKLEAVNGRLKVVPDEKEEEKIDLDSEEFDESFVILPGEERPASIVYNTPPPPEPLSTTPPPSPFQPPISPRNSFQLLRDTLRDSLQIHSPQNPPSTSPRNSNTWQSPRNPTHSPRNSTQPRAPRPTTPTHTTPTQPPRPTTQTTPTHTTPQRHNSLTTPTQPQRPKSLPATPDRLGLIHFDPSCTNQVYEVNAAYLALHEHCTHIPTDSTYIVLPESSQFIMFVSTGHIRFTNRGERDILLRSHKRGCARSHHIVGNSFTLTPRSSHSFDFKGAWFVEVVGKCDDLIVSDLALSGGGKDNKLGMA